MRAARALLGWMIVSGASCGRELGDLELRWTINALAGSETGLDRCEEVLAANARILTLDGPEQIEAMVPCRGSAQWFYRSDVRLGTYRLGLELLGSDAQVLTTQLPATVEVTPITGLGRVNFDPAAFVKSRNVIRGTYRFRTRFGGQSCGGAQPRPAQQQLRLTTASGAPVTDATVCVGAVCVPADGQATLPCSDGEQSIANLPWGEYNLQILTRDEGDGCWRRQQPILVGAGNNPVVDHLLTHGGC